MLHLYIPTSEWTHVRCFRFLPWPQLVAFLKHHIDHATSKGDLQVRVCCRSYAAVRNRFGTRLCHPRIHFLALPSHTHSRTRAGLDCHGARPYRLQNHAIVRRLAFTDYWITRHRVDPNHSLMRLNSPFFSFPTPPLAQIC